MKLLVVLVVMAMCAVCLAQIPPPPPPPPAGSGSGSGAGLGSGSGSAVGGGDPVNATCIVKMMHLLPDGAPIDVRIAGQLIAANLEFQRSQVTQANVPCGLQPIVLFPAGNETSFRTDEFLLAGGENIYNYIVFGGEIDPNGTNVFLLSSEPVVMPVAAEGQTQLSFWHYAPAVRLQQVQLDVEDATNTTLLTILGNFQQRSDYQSIPVAPDALNFRFSNLALEELLFTNRSLTGVKNSAGTIFLFGRNVTDMWLEADPVATSSTTPPPSGSSAEGSSSSGGNTFVPPPPPPPPPVQTGSSSSSSSAPEPPQHSSASTLVPNFFFFF
jgi:hypothetical protein